MAEVNTLHKEYEEEQMDITEEKGMPVDEEMKEVIRKEVIMKNKCKSCEQETIVFANISNTRDLLFCQLCSPWVLGSIYKAPGYVNGIKIDDAELFERMLKVIDDLEEPQCEREWFELLNALHPKKHSVLDEIDMQLDYRESNESSTGIEILAKIRKHVSKFSAIGSDRRELSDNGWYNYAREIDWPEFEILQFGLHEIRLEPRSDGTNPVVEVDSIKISKPNGNISDELLSELIFDSINSLSSVKLSKRISIFSDVEKIIKIFEFDYDPWTPYILEHLVEIISGNQGKKLQYKLLAIIYKWKRALKPSHDFLIRDKEVWTRAFQFLRAVINGLGSDATYCLDGIRVKGSSGNWYHISRSNFPTDVQCWEVKSERNGISIGPICIDINKDFKNLPLGDQLASVVHSLNDDFGTMHLISTLEAFM